MGDYSVVFYGGEEMNKFLEAYVRAIINWRSPWYIPLPENNQI